VPLKYICSRKCATPLFVSFSQRDPTREMIAIYAKCCNTNLEWAISLLGEIISMPKYDDEYIEKSKENILKEMENIERNYKEVVFDYLHATAFQGTALERSILGTEKIIKHISSKDLYDFINNYYKAPKIVLVASGDIDHSNLDSLANKYLGNISCNYETGIDQRALCRFTGSDIRDRDDELSLGHVTIAFEGPGCAHADSIPLLIASNIYGSFDNTYGGTIYSSNNTSVISFKNGNMHSFQNFFIPYHDTSLWGVYYTATGHSMQLITEYVIQRVVRLCANISEFEVNRAKNNLKTKLLHLKDSSMVCDELGHQLITYGRRIPLDEMFARIDLVNANQIRDVCGKYIYDKCPAIAGYGPIEGLTDYNNIRSRTWWLRY